MVCPRQRTKRRLALAKGVVGGDCRLDKEGDRRTSRGREMGERRDREEGEGEEEAQEGYLHC